MPDNVYAVSEIVGSSTEGVDDAIRGAIDRAGRTLRGLDWFEVTEIRGHLSEGAHCHTQVTLKVGFRLEETPPGDLQRDGEVLDRTNLPEMTPGSSLT